MRLLPHRSNTCQSSRPRLGELRGLGWTVDVASIVTNDLGAVGEETIVSGLQAKAPVEGPFAALSIVVAKIELRNVFVQTDQFRSEGFRATGIILRHPEAVGSIERIEL